jgi:hypothetical protein
MPGMLDGTHASASLLGKLARQHTAHALVRLVEVLDGDDPRAAVEAARELLNRGYGAALLPLAFDANGVSVEVNASGEDEPDVSRERVNGKSWRA